MLNTLFHLLVVRVFCSSSRQLKRNISQSVAPFRMLKYLQAYLPAFDSGKLQFSVQGDDVYVISIRWWKHSHLIASFHFSFTTEVNRDISVGVSKRRLRTEICAACSSLYLSCLDFCDEVFTCLNQPTLAQHQRVQNAAAGLLTKTLFFLHLLPIKFGIDFKILLIAFKAQHGLGPQLYYTAIYSLHFEP